MKKTDIFVNITHKIICSLQIAKIIDNNSKVPAPNIYFSNVQKIYICEKNCQTNDTSPIHITKALPFAPNAKPPLIQKVHENTRFFDNPHQSPNK